MRVLLYPADEFGCGLLRMSGPAMACRDRGYDAVTVDPQERRVTITVDPATGAVTHVGVPEDTDVIVFQRPSHLWIAQAVPYLRSKGYAVVVDVDDDLHSIHKDNPAYNFLDPIHMARRHRAQDGSPFLHSWDNVAAACEAASLVTVSTPGLLKRYARHGRGRVIPNYLPDHYYGHPRIDNTDIGWPAALNSHPNDPAAVGTALARVIRERGVRFRAFGVTAGVNRAFGLPGEDPPDDLVDVMDWPAAIATLGVAIAPLADTTFNSRKSALKVLELSAAGVPWIASPRREYAKIHALGAGQLADSGREWHTQLTALVTSASHREELSQAGRAVAETMRLRDHADLWWQAWQDALVTQRGKAALIG